MPNLPPCIQWTSRWHTCIATWGVVVDWAALILSFQHRLNQRSFIWEQSRDSLLHVQAKIKAKYIHSRRWMEAASNSVRTTSPITKLDTSRVNDSSGIFFCSGYRESCNGIQRQRSDHIRFFCLLTLQGNYIYRG